MTPLAHRPNGISLRMPHLIHRWRGIKCAAVLRGHRRPSIWLVVLVFFFANTPAPSEINPQAADQTALQAVALLFHGRYGEDPYKLVPNSDGSVGVEETGGRSLRFLVQPVAGSNCVFHALFETPSGRNVERLDFSKFSGAHETIEACGQVGTPFEGICNASLRFDEQAGGFCQYVFSSRNVDLRHLSFPKEACRSFGYGARAKTDYPKYIAAFDAVYKRCVDGGRK